MSILIKGIDLPRKGKIIKLEIEDDGTVWEIGKEWEHYGLSATQIPTPHGRLVDVDKIFTYSHWEEQAVSEAPTILEVEE